MIEINSLNNSILEFGIDIQNTSKSPKSARLVIPINEELKMDLVIEGKLVGKSALVTVPPIETFFEGDKIENVRLEVIINEDGMDTLFEVINDTMKITKPIKVEACLNETKIEPIKQPMVRATIKSIEQKPVEENIEPKKKENKIEDDILFIDNIDDEF